MDNGGTKSKTRGTQRGIWGTKKDNWGVKGENWVTKGENWEKRGKTVKQRRTTEVQCWANGSARAWAQSEHLPARPFAEHRICRVFAGCSPSQTACNALHSVFCTLIGQSYSPRLHRACFYGGQSSTPPPHTCLSTPTIGASDLRGGGAAKYSLEGEGRRALLWVAGSALPRPRTRLPARDSLMKSRVVWRHA